jgi:AraC-like DNA-binding protein
MNYLEVRPSKLLEPYINCFWYYQGVEGRVLEDCTFPDGSIEVIFNISTDVQKSFNGDLFHKNPEVEIVGQFSSPYYVSCKGENRFLGIRFYPHTFCFFSKTPLHEINNCSVAAEDLLGKGFKEAYCLIQDKNNLHHSISVLENLLLRKIIEGRNDTKFEIVNYAIDKFFSESRTLSVDEILKTCHINARYLQRIFLERVGCSPKLLAKIIRFQKTFAYLNSNTLSLTRIAYECGYFDQAHFIRDFRQFTRMTPSAYHHMNHPINNHFLSSENLSYLYAKHKW